MTHTATIDGRMRDGEMLRRFPEIRNIKDKELRAQTLDALCRGTPSYFWEVPATSSGHYHNPFARSKHGLWIHVKMGFTVFERQADSKIQLGFLSEKEADMVRSAILLHDILKYGHKYQPGDHTVKNHDLLAGAWLRHNTDLPEQVVRAVESHNGPWYEGPSPKQNDEVSRAVHEADLNASTKNGTWGLYEPHEDLVKKYPNVPQAVFE